MAKCKKARKAYEKVKKTAKPGTGKRFKALTKSLKESGAKNPKAVAAMIGRKKYGKEKMQKWAAKGRKQKK